MRLFSLSTKRRLSTETWPTITAVKSGYWGRRRHIASTNRSLPFCLRTRPKVPIPYLPGRPVAANAAARSAGGLYASRSMPWWITVDGRSTNEARHGARRDDRVHAVDQEPGVGRLPPLPGRIEDELQPPAEALQDEPEQHFRVAAGVPDARRTPFRRRPEAQPHEVEEAQAGDPVRPVGAEPDGVAALGDQRRDRAVDRGDAGIALLEVRE